MARTAGADDDLLLPAAAIVEVERGGTTRAAARFEEGGRLRVRVENEGMPEDAFRLTLLLRRPEGAWVAELRDASLGRTGKSEWLSTELPLPPGDYGVVLLRWSKPVSTVPARIEKGDVTSITIPLPR